MENNNMILRSVKSVSEAQSMIAPLINKSITNEILGTAVKLYPKSVKKMGSPIATSKSITPALHAKAVANVDVLYRNALFEITHPDRKNRPNIEQVHRVGSIMYDERNKEYVPVMITVIEYKAMAQGNSGEKLVDNLYSVEVVDVPKNEKVRRTPAANLDEEGHAPIADFYAKMRELLDNINQ